MVIFIKQLGRMIEIPKDLSNSTALLVLLVSTLVLILVASSAFPTSFVYAKNKVKQQHGSQSPTSSSSSSSTSYTASPSSCITYDPTARLITISCQSAHLSDVYNQVRDHTVLEKEPQGVWVLNANVTINKGSTLNIDPTDTNWLKIIAD
jgi:hypothetical protein